MSCQTPTVSDITLLNQFFFFFPNFLERRQCIYLQYWLDKNVRMFYTKKVSVSRMILKCNSEDVKKARISKSSFLISDQCEQESCHERFFSKHVPWYFNRGRAFIDLRESTDI